MHRDDDRDALDRLLRVVPVRVDSGFTDGVMRRVAQAPRAASAGQTFAASSWPAAANPMLPWWARALLEPATLLAFAAAALVAGWPLLFLEQTSRLAGWLARHVTLSALGGSDGWIAWSVVSMVGSLLIVGLALRATQSFFTSAGGRAGARAPR